MVPYMKNRALMMQRFPEGLKGEFFYQKDAASYFPAWIKRVRIAKEGGLYRLCSMPKCSNACLSWQIRRALLPIWLSRIDKSHFPDQAYF